MIATFGSGVYGALGHGDCVDRAAPTLVSLADPEPGSSMDAYQAPCPSTCSLGARHTAVVSTSGELRCPGSSKRKLRDYNFPVYITGILHSTRRTRARLPTHRARHPASRQRREKCSVAVRGWIIYWGSVCWWTARHRLRGSDGISHHKTITRTIGNAAPYVSNADPLPQVLLGCGASHRAAG